MTMRARMKILKQKMTKKILIKVKVAQLLNLVARSNLKARIRKREERKRKKKKKKKRRSKRNKKSRRRMISPNSDSSPISYIYIYL